MRPNVLVVFVTFSRSRNNCCGTVTDFSFKLHAVRIIILFDFRQNFTLKNHFWYELRRLNLSHVSNLSSLFLLPSILSITACLLKQDKRVCLISGILNAYTIGLTNESK